VVNTMPILGHGPPGGPHERADEVDHATLLSHLLSPAPAARYTAIHGSRSQAEPTADVTECPRPAG